MVNMSTKIDEDAQNGSVSIMFTRSRHDTQIDGHKKPQQQCDYWTDA